MKVLTKKRLKEAMEKIFNRLLSFILDLPSDSPTDQNTYHHNGKKYIATEGRWCTSCSFYNKPECDNIKCTPVERDDKKQVVWKMDRK